MGIYFSLLAIPIGPDGELELRSDSGPHLSVPDGEICELFDPVENRRFGPAVRGLEFAWYRRTTMEICTEESREPRRGDCYEPRLLVSELTTVRERLERLESQLPRRYMLRKSTDPSQNLTGVRFFHGGKLFRAGAGWDLCRAVWSADRPDFMSRITHLVSEPPDIVLDWRDRETFACIDCVVTRDSSGTQKVQQGPPLTLHISSVSAYEFFRKPLEEMTAFVERARAGGATVFTNRW